MYKERAASVDLSCPTTMPIWLKSARAASYPEKTHRRIARHYGAFLALFDQKPRKARHSGAFLTAKKFAPQCANDDGLAIFTKLLHG